MWVSLINKEINNTLKKKLKKKNWIQNDNQNAWSRSTPQSLTVIITSSLVTFYSIMLQSFDAVLCLMIVLDDTWKHVVLVSSSLKFCREDV